MKTLLSIAICISFGFAPSKSVKHCIYFSEMVRIIDIENPMNVMVQEGPVFFKVYKDDPPLHVVITTESGQSSNLILCYGPKVKAMYTYHDTVFCN